MDQKDFAIPMNNSSVQDGDTNMQHLVSSGLSAVMELGCCTAGSADTLNMITRKNGSNINHIFAATVGADSVARVTLSASNLQTIYGDADTEWDYVDAHWSIGMINVGGNSVMKEVQGGVVYNMNGWPPKTK